MANYPRVTHPCATLTAEYCYPSISVRLACLIHAASVRSEPESNSPLEMVSLKLVRWLTGRILQFKTLRVQPLTGRPQRGSHLSHNSIFKEQRAFPLKILPVRILTTSSHSLTRRTTSNAPLRGQKTPVPVPFSRLGI